MDSRREAYLAGPITGLTFGEAQDWRDYAIKRLAEYHIKGLTPLRGKEFLVKYGELSADGYDSHPLASAKGITTRDRFDCQRADVVLMNLLGADRISVGTMIEAGWADAARRPVVLAMEDENVHRHVMLKEIAGYITADLDTAIDIVIAILK